MLIVIVFCCFSRDTMQFPVKLTDPLTAIMYITSDKKHMEELRLAIHVKENVIGGYSQQNSIIWNYTVV